MSKKIRRILLWAIFIGGFSSLSLELIVMRQLSGFVGATAVTASIIIGVIMAFMSWGYYAGSVFPLAAKAVRRRVIKAFYFLALWAILAASYILIYLYFALFDYLGVKSTLVKSFIYCLALLSYPSYLFGQITSLLSRFLHKYNRNFTGKLMAVDTIGSVLGSLLSTLVLMPLLGVNYTIVVIICLCLSAALILQKSFDIYWALTIAVAGVLLNRSQLLYDLFAIVENNAVSTISVFEADEGKSKVMVLNGSAASKISQDDKLLFPYIQYIENNFLKTLPLQDKKHILILGAGGFTLGRNDDFNNYTYVDVDKALLPLSEKYFLNEKLGANKKFELQDANQFLKEDKTLYDLIVLDTYSSTRVIPQDLVTQEYFYRVKSHLKDGGIIVMNLISSPNFSDKFSMNLDNTLRSVFQTNLQRQVIGGFDPWQKGKLSNVIYVYYHHQSPARIYTINRNASFLDN